jgi:hypothetical protein
MCLGGLADNSIIYYLWVAQRCHVSCWWFKETTKYEVKDDIASVNYTTLDDHKVRHLPRNYNRIVVFTLLPIDWVHLIGNNTNLVTMGSMDTKVDGHPWTKSNVNNIVIFPEGVGCRKKLCVGVLRCINKKNCIKKKFGMTFLHRQ